MNYRSKMFCPLVFTSLFVIGSVAHATAYDFGNTLNASPNFTDASSAYTQQATPVGGFDKLAYEQSSNSYSFSPSGEHVLSDSRRFDFVPDRSARKPAASLINSSVLSPVVYIDVQSTGGADSARYQPVAAVAEPQTYLMLLSGFVLLCFSARRRKHDTFN